MDRRLIGVCSWSVDRHDVVHALRIAGSELGLHAAQVGFFTSRALDQANAADFLAASRQCGVSIVGTFVAFEDEDYGSISRIARTGGLAPADRFDRRREQIRQAAKLAVELGSPSVALHVGTIPADASDPSWAALKERTCVVAGDLRAIGCDLLLETGREPAAALAAFLEACSAPNVHVNFDPANFVTYGADDPVTAARVLRPWIRLVHVKDARRSPEPGVTYGGRAELGAGDVDLPRVLSKLRAGGYDGPLLIENNQPDAGLGAVTRAAEYLRSILG